MTSLGGKIRVKCLNEDSRIHCSDNLQITTHINDFTGFSQCQREGYSICLVLATTASRQSVS